MKYRVNEATTVLQFNAMMTKLVLLKEKSKDSMQIYYDKGLCIEVPDFEVFDKTLKDWEDLSLIARE